MTLPETKIGLVFASAEPGVRVEGAAREDAPDEFVEPPRCAVACVPAHTIMDIVQMTNLRK